MGNVTVLSSPDDVDLTHHGVIEAHAGTGKTYTIGQLVLRILCRPDEKASTGFVHVRDLLLVTFTEKAAGELKTRIRHEIERSLQKSPQPNDALRLHLEDCLNNMHEAFIGTIHGVCLRLLKTWPFETGAHFSAELVDDAQGMAEELRQSLRTDWQDTASSIPWALERLVARGEVLTEKHYATVVELANQLLDAENTVLERRHLGGLKLPQLRRLLEAGVEAYGECAAWKDFCSLVESCIETMRAIIDDPQGLFNDDILMEFRRRIDEWTIQLTRGIRPEEFASLKTFDGKRPIKTAKSRSHQLFDRLEKLHEDISRHLFLEILSGGTILGTLLCDAAEIVRDRWERAKRRRALISYHDMLQLMYRAVHNNPVFCSALRRRLRYGIIDEFQDTGTLQWLIFKRIFLDAPEGGPRLFIVGDPKQSIYAFQGADVQSYGAAREAIVRGGGRLYCLTENFRSTPKLIDACNTILAADPQNPDWFACQGVPSPMMRISYPTDIEGGMLARPPQRPTPLPSPLSVFPVQAMVLVGNAEKRRRTMAAWTSLIIRSLHGTTISIPRGKEWEEIELDYRHFAVIVESHRLANPFIEQFNEDGIPFVKYKMEGVFQSEMARDLHALLRAVLHPGGDPAPRLACLLTRFFNIHPAGLDHTKSLEACSDQSACEDGNTCLAHALQEWTELVKQRRWARLFARILERTSVRERLIRLIGGERLLADLSQIIDYCIEKLYRSKMSLAQLVEHLGCLLNGQESAGEYLNYHTAATSRSSVYLLTMHAAKGLEFPVVFAVTGASSKGSRAILRWIDTSGKRRVALLYGSSGAARLVSETAAEAITITSWTITDQGLQICRKNYAIAEAQAIQERRRLLYVAMTRAQALLFLPLHLASRGQGQGGASDWRCCTLPVLPDTDLTPRLLYLLDRRKLACFCEDQWRNNGSRTTEVDCLSYLDPQWTLPAQARIAEKRTVERIVALGLNDRICRQISYTELTHQITAERELDRSGGDDSDTTLQMSLQGETFPHSDLPRGNATGDALHRAIETLMGMEHIDVQTVDGAWLWPFLEAAGIFAGLDEAAQHRAAACGATILRRALTYSYRFPFDFSVVIADTAKSCRAAEMEFQLCMGSAWIHGFIDLVLRCPNSHAGRHPWRYYVLDWKSDSLHEFSSESVACCISKRHYDMQAAIYCYALHRYLAAILGPTYDPQENLGGAVYVLLRSFETPQEHSVHAWIRKADPRADEQFVKACFAGLHGVGLTQALAQATFSVEVKQ